MNPEASVSRGDRVAAEVAQTLAALIERQYDDRRLHLVTITEVRMSPDLKQAHVFASSADPATDADTALAALRGAGHRLRRELAARLRLRSVPWLDFEWDRRGAEAQRLDALIARGLPAHPDVPGEEEPT